MKHSTTKNLSQRTASEEARNKGTIKSQKTMNKMAIVISYILILALNIVD